MEEIDLKLYRINQFINSFKFVTLRLKKCKRIYDILSEKRIFLLKSPPGSGKTFFGELFQLYLYQEKMSEIEKVVFVNVGNAQNQTVEFILKNCGYGTLTDFIDNKSKKNYYLILDEIPYLYSQKYEDFWKMMKEIHEKSGNIKVLGLAVYLELVAPTPTPSPLIFKNKSMSLEFMRFEEDEMAELAESYQLKKIKGNLIITPEIQRKILEETGGHAELVSLTITFFHNQFEDSSAIPNWEQLKEKMNQSIYFKNVIGVCKATYFYELHLKQKSFDVMKKIAFYDSQFFSLNEYKQAKLLEKLGLVYENIETSKFNFISNSIKNRIFHIIFQDKPNYLTESQVNSTDILTFTAIVLKKLKRTNLSNVLKNKKTINPKFSISEDQWVNEFYRTVCCLLHPDFYRVNIQASKEVHKDFLGELDIHINSGLNYNIELTRNSNLVWQHVMRFKNDSPEIFKDPRMEGQGYYPLEAGAQYLVIDLIEKKDKKSFKKLEEPIIFGKTDYLASIKEHLMRVVYDREIKILEVFYKEKLYDVIELN